MVVRIATVWVLVATLGVCPFACLAESVAALTASKVEHGSGAADCCCAPSGTPAGDRGPGDRDPSEKGGSCLCHGAVMADHAPDSELHPAPVFWTIPARSASMAFGLSTVGAPAERHACHFANVESGREVRALIESFLL